MLGYPAIFMSSEFSTWLRKGLPFSQEMREPGASEAFLFRAIDMMLGGLEQTHKVIDLVNTRNPDWNYFQGLKVQPC